MMDPRTSVPDILSAAAALEGHRVCRVRYYGLWPRDVVEWDFGNWHNPVHGVDFELDNHSILSTLWGDSFGHFSLEIVAGPVSRFLISVDQQEGPISWDVTHHPRWAPALSGPVLRAHVLWDNKGEWTDLWGSVVRRAPIALRLDFRIQTVWVLAGKHDPAASGPLLHGRRRGHGSSSSRHSPRPWVCSGSRKSPRSEPAIPTPVPFRATTGCCRACGAGCCRACPRTARAPGSASGACGAAR